MKYKNIYEEIFERMKSSSSTAYLNIFAGDDQKKDKQVFNQYLDLHSTEISKIKSQIEINNTGSLGVFMNFNLLVEKKRNNNNIKKILYIFIDLDNAKEEHNQTIKTNLEGKNIYYSYNCKSGNGYHFLIPVNLEPNDKPLVKGFLEYLRNNVCDKVDVATHTNERLIRCPESIHNKNDKNPIELKTLEYKTLDELTIENNNLEIKKYQEVAKKGIRGEDYIKQIKREDVFFSSVLNNHRRWDDYIKYLHNSQQRNNIFIKNLGIFISLYPNYSVLAQDFIKSFEPARVLHLEGWVKKSQLNNMNVNYYELLKWSKEYNLEDFYEILKEEQLRNLFLDNYEIYYLEDEKTESNTLLYYPEKNYYVQKSLQEVLNNIYYDCKESGIDLVEELSIRSIYEKWEEFNFKKQFNLICDQLRRVIEKENRIRLVYNVNYEPSEDKFVYLGSKKFFNIYNKTNLWDYYKKQNKYHFPNIKELLYNLCGSEDKNYNWFVKWLGWQIQYPTEKLPTAVIFQGKQGSGKGTFKNLILDNIFGDNCQEINQTHLESSFNDYLLGKQIVVANEVMHNENRQTLPNVLKNLITDPFITINIKFKKSITGKNYTHWIFCTNSDNPIKIDEDDRRYSVFYSQKMRKGLGHEIRTNLDYELKEFISYLKDLEIEFDEVSEPIMTEAKEEIIDLNKDSYARFREYCSQFKSIDELWVSLFDYLDTELKLEKDGIEYILTDKFYLLYEKYCEKFKERGIFAKQNFSKKLSNEGIKSSVQRLENTTPRCYELETIKNKIIVIDTEPIDCSSFLISYLQEQQDNGYSTTNIKEIQKVLLESFSEDIITKTIHSLSKKGIISQQRVDEWRIN